MDCPASGDTATPMPDPCVEAGVSEFAATAPGATLELNGDYWRREVSTRLERYRARRKPRAPRYPSLRLPFDHADSWLPVSSSALAVSSTAVAAELTPESRSEPAAPHLVDRIAELPVPELYTNVIEFPRSAAVPAYHASELAEPVFDRPRIVEAPEVLPPPPALGGILMEPARDLEPERGALPGLALPSATLPRRMLAGLLDALILVASLAGFGAMFVWVNPQYPPLPVLAMAVMIVSLVLWAAYEFLFTVYTGSTPGVRMAGLQLVRFDGAPTPLRLRRWRVLTSYVSAFSLGLGYLWSVLDEDGLCWHDRITHTYFYWTPPPVEVRSGS